MLLTWCIKKWLTFSRMIFLLGSISLLISKEVCKSERIKEEKCFSMGPGVRDGRSLKLNTKIEGGLRNARGVKYTQRDTTATMTKPNP